MVRDLRARINHITQIPEHSANRVQIVDDSCHLAPEKGAFEDGFIAIS